MSRIGPGDHDVTQLHSPDGSRWWAATAGDGAKSNHSRSVPEMAPHGIRVVGLRPQAMPESVGSTRRFYESRAETTGLTWERFQELLAARTHPQRLMTLEEMANVAVFMASDQASGMTGTTVNLTMGSLDD